MITLFSKESGKRYEIPFFDDENFDSYVSPDYIKKRYDVYGEQSWARDFIGWEVETDDEAEWHKNWGTTAEKASRAWKKLNDFLNDCVPRGYEDFPTNGDLDDVARYFCNYLNACDDVEIYAVRKGIVSMYRELKREAATGKVIRHVEKNMRSDFDFVSYDIIKGENGNYYIKGEGGARTIFGKESEWSPGLLVGGSGTYMIDPYDYGITETEETA